MMIELAKIVPARQLLIAHADLGEVEWAGNVAHIRATTGAQLLEDYGTTESGLPLIIAKPVRSFLQMVEDRGKWPSPQQRQCTSDL